MRAEIRVALIGFGDAGRQIHAPLISSTPGLTLAVIGSSQGISAGSAYPGVVVVPDWLAAARHPDVDLVVIATPNDTHAPLAEAALLAGKHVVVDKPFTVTLAEARALAATARAAERELSVFQNRRWDSDFLGIAGELAAGRIGEVVEFRSEISRFRPQIRDRWRERAGPGAGIWYDLAPHLVDQALVLFGSPETVQADLQIQRSGGSTVDWFHSVLGYSRTRIILTSSSIAADGGMRFLVRGTNGSLSKRRGDLLDDHVADPLVLVTGEGETPIEIAAPAGDHRSYYIALRDALHGEGKLPVTPAQATTLMAIIEAGVQSSDEGRVVRPDYTEAERLAWEPVRKLS
jgi:predicted dehydrogenase